MNTEAMKELYQILWRYDKQKRFEKAARHLEDALELRCLRHDIDSNWKKIEYLSFLATESMLVKFCYKLQTHKNWNNFLTILVWVFIAMAIIEPPHMHIPTFFEENPSYFPVLLTIEIIVLSFFLLDLAMDIFHRTSDYHRTFNVKFIYNKKMVTKVVLLFLFVLDFILFYSSLPENDFRFSRPFRPCKLFLFNYILVFFTLTNRQMRRTIEGLLRSAKELFVIVLFFIIICILYAIVGMRIIGDISEEAHNVDDVS